MKEVELETSSFPWIIAASLPFLSVKTPAVLLKLLSWYVLTSCSLTLVLWRLWYLLRALWSPHIGPSSWFTLAACDLHPTCSLYVLWLVICSEFCPHFLVTWLRWRHFISNIKFRHLTFWPPSSFWFLRPLYLLLDHSLRSSLQPVVLQSDYFFLSVAKTLIHHLISSFNLTSTYKTPIFLSFYSNRSPNHEQIQLYAFYEMSNVKTARKSIQLYRLALT